MGGPGRVRWRKERKGGGGGGWREEGGWKTKGIRREKGAARGQGTNSFFSNKLDNKCKLPKNL
jgi:hypothetical protein